MSFLKRSALMFFIYFFLIILVPKLPVIWFVIFVAALGISFIFELERRDESKRLYKKAQHLLSDSMYPSENTLKEAYRILVSIKEEKMKRKIELQLAQIEFCLEQWVMFENRILHLLSRKGAYVDLAFKLLYMSFMVRQDYENAKSAELHARKRRIVFNEVDNELILPAVKQKFAA